jgi:hypothetical protein
MICMQSLEKEEFWFPDSNSKDIRVRFWNIVTFLLNEFFMKDCDQTRTGT